MYEKYLIADFPFENDLNDRCKNYILEEYENTYIDKNTYKTFDKNYCFDNALYFNNSIGCFIRDIKITKKNFTISLWSSTSDTNNNYFLYLGENYETNRVNNFCFGYNCNKLRMKLINLNDFHDVFDDDIIFNIFNLLIISYDYYNNKLYIRFNNNFRTYNTTGIDIANLINNKIIYLGVPYQPWKGSIAYFKIYDGIAICTNNNPNFDFSFTYNTSNVNINLNSNTKRLFSFNYDYNTNRTTKWNQKVNYYVMDPNIYKKG